MQKRTRMTVISIVLAIIVASIGILVARSASATPHEGCTPSEPWAEQIFDHWQRYSWTGGPHESNDPPPFPSSDWQPNVQGDPHGVGVSGAYYRSHGGSGKGDWFYLEAVSVTVQHPGKECPPPTEEPTPKETPTPTVPPVTETPTVPPVTETPTVPPTTETPVPTPPVTETPVPPVPPTTETPVPTPPKNNPPKDNPPPWLIECVDGVWVTTQGEKVISRSGTCDDDNSPPAPVQFTETGM